MHQTSSGMQLIGVGDNGYYSKILQQDTTKGHCDRSTTATLARMYFPQTDNIQPELLSLWEGDPQQLPVL